MSIWQWRQMEEINYYDIEGYRDALEKSGAVVHDYLEAGSYQGNWIAAVEFNGNRGWILDSYGSCSGCDALQAELGYESTTLNKLKSFTKTYLDALKTTTEVEREAKERVEWDSEYSEFPVFIERNKSWVDRSS